ncbi:gas vesicle protein GvpJ [Halopiger xanaduensis]|uniref:gas vesicle protein GvpJ n=1 Tax=Halopiger xanaduensis TaxID=387343 RepID=UPI000677751E|nr:gas vesicle protein GvpJ [Halopiger xanaduensis]
MVDDFQPSRQKADLAEVVEMLLDKGIVINADIAVSIGDTQLLGVQLRAAIASFETAAKYGLEFPEGTDMRRVAEAAGDPELAEMERPKPPIDPTRGVNATADERYADEERLEGERADDAGESESADGGTESDEPPARGSERVGARPNPDRPTSGGVDLISGDDSSDSSAENDGDDGSDATNSETESDETTEGN